MRKFLVMLGGALLLTAATANAAEGPEIPKQRWSFNGIFGTYDLAAAQRGFQIYQEVCSACHALEHVAYHDLSELGYNEDEIKAIAAQKEVDDINDEGQPVKRPARPADRFVKPFPNEKAARAANNGGYPPDLSMIAKAREGGPDYVYAILTGYEPPPPDFKLGDGMNYNKAFPGHQIAMPQPLNDGTVTFADGTSNTLPQEAHDVVTFLMWAAEPNLDERHRTGFKVILFLIVTTGFVFAVKRRIWADVEH
jgi:ubiquinol-cytochrome c reductase cytochrome c1 subunit